VLLCVLPPSFTIFVHEQKDVVGELFCFFQANGVHTMKVIPINVLQQLDRHRKGFQVALKVGSLDGGYQGIMVGTMNCGEASRQRLESSPNANFRNISV